MARPKGSKNNPKNGGTEAAQTTTHHRTQINVKEAGNATQQVGAILWNVPEALQREILSFYCNAIGYFPVQETPRAMTARAGR